MRSILLPAAAALAAALAAGCSGGPTPLPMATTPEKAGAAIREAFDAWKAGKTPADLKAESPAVYLADDDFQKGRKLVDYTIEGEPVPSGTGMRFVVSFTVSDGGKTTARKHAYRVVTDPNISISKEDMKV